MYQSSKYHCDCSCILKCKNKRETRQTAFNPLHKMENLIYIIDCKKIHNLLFIQSVTMSTERTVSLSIVRPVRPSFLPYVCCMACPSVFPSGGMSVNKKYSQI